MQEKSITNQKHFPEGAHLVGSIPFQNSEQVFRASCKVLGRYLRRLSDGETGERSIWIRWQYSKLASIPELEVSSDSIEYTLMFPRISGEKDKSPILEAKGNNYESGTTDVYTGVQVRSS